MHRFVIAASTLFLASGAAEAQTVRFDGQRAVKVHVTNVRELMTVRALADDILTCEGSGVGSFDIRVTPEHYAALVASGVRNEVLIKDIQAHMDRIWADDARIRAADDPAWFATYRTLAEFDARISHYATNYPALATLSTIGTSIQGRPIKLLRITGPGSTTNRPAIVIQANQHAREWITPHAAMYMIDRFCETYGTDSRVTNIVNEIDFHFIVTANPDGYEYSRTTDAAWRKNRRANSGAGGCTGTFGVDLNRNWGYQWGFDNLGSSGTCSSTTYRGTAAFSEPELAGIKSLVDALAAQGRLRAHLDIHTNGRMLLSPWGFQVAPAPADLPLMDALGQLMKDGMQSIRGTEYPYGQGSVILYLSNGCTRDYTYGVHGQMAWTIELAGNSFQPPVSEILPIAQEALAGLLPLAEYFIPAPACYANCDQSTSAPVLNANDFNCFLNQFAAGLSLANCDNSTTVPVLNANDFNCFLNAYAAGCP